MRDNIGPLTTQLITVITKADVSQTALSCLSATK